MVAMLEHINHKNLMKSLPQLLLVGSSLLIFISVLYNLAYFQIIAPEYFNLLTINDHLNSALGWLAYSPVAILPYVLWHYGLRIQDATINKVIDWLRKITRSRKILRFLSKKKFNKRKISYILLTIEITVIVITVIPISIYTVGKILPYSNEFLAGLGFTHQTHSYLKMLVLALFYFLIVAYSTNNFKHWFVRLFIISPLIIIPLITGRTEAEYVIGKTAEATKERKQFYRITSDHFNYDHVLIMRSLEKGLIFRDTQECAIKFITWDKIKNLSSEGEFTEDVELKQCVMPHHNPLNISNKKCNPSLSK